MPIAMRHRDDPTPALPPLSGFAVEREFDAERMAALQGRSTDEMLRRFDAGHRAYVASLHGDAAAWGWVATTHATIGELQSTFHIASDERYLWNFVTLSSHRGLGIYPRLLQAIVRAESVEATRFWIAYAPENRASGTGIAKAGFATLAEMSFDASERPSLRDLVPGGALLASRLLGLPATAEPLAPCWRCVKAGRSGMTCAAGSCQCDYQQPRSGCAA